MRSNKFVTTSMTLALIGATILGSSSPLYAKTNILTLTKANTQTICKTISNIKVNANTCNVNTSTKNTGNTGTSTTSKPTTSTSTTSKPTTSTPATNTSTTNTSTTNTSTQAANENKVLELVNAERAKQGLKALQMDESLRNVARLKSQDMSKNKYFSHTSPTYGSPFDMLKKFGVSYKSAGENIAQGYKTPEAVVTGWMNSSGHRANILNAKFTHLGVGYEASGNYWTQTFIGK